jgi:hypothetical protein
MCALRAPQQVVSIPAETPFSADPCMARPNGLNSARRGGVSSVEAHLFEFPTR